MTEDLIRLDNQLETLGWEQPARFIVPREEPLILAEIDGHPCDVLQSMWRSGVRVNAATSLALVVEGLRHLRLEEVEAEVPRMHDQMVAMAAQEQENGEVEEIQTLIQNAWLSTIADMSPLSMPPELTRQVRNTIVVLHTGWTLSVVRDRGGDPEVLDPIPPDRLEKSRVPHFMWQYLHDEEPRD